MLAHIHKVDLILSNFMNNEMDFDIHRNEWIIFRYKTAVTNSLDLFRINLLLTY